MPITSTVGNQSQSLGQLARCQEIDRHGRPDQPRTDRRQQRQERHQHRPQQHALNPQEPEGDAAQGALRHGHHDIAFDRGARHRGELGNEAALVVGLERNRLDDARDQAAAVAQQEKQQIHHHAEADDELERVLPDVDRLRRHELAGLRGTGRQLVLQRSQIAQPQTVEQAQHPFGHGQQHLLQVGAEVELPLSLIHI